jgi:hypothetical protein
MMMRKIIFYPLYEETMVVESVTWDTVEHGVSYTHHYTLKTPRAVSWEVEDLCRELADHLDAREP